MTITAPSSASWLDDGLTTFAPTGGGIQTGYGQVSGAGRVIDLGSAVTPWHGVVAFEPSVLDQSSGNEVYQLYVEGCASADFSGARQDLASWTVGALNAQDVTGLSNVYDEIVYRYIRLKIVVSGTTPQIAVKTFVKPLSDLDAYTLAELITLQHVLAQNIQNASTNFRAWMAGEINGGPNGDGKYPLSDGLGNTVLVACPARMAADGTDPFPDANIDLLGGTETDFDDAVAAARTLRKPLTGRDGTVVISGPKIVTACSVNLPFKTISFADNLGAGTVLKSQDYAVGSTGAPVTLTVKGPAVELGLLPMSATVLNYPGTYTFPPHYEKIARFDGNFADPLWNQSQPFTAVRIRGDQGARASYDIAIQNHRGDGLEIHSDTEKKLITYRFDHLYHGSALAFRALDGLSPDEVSVRMVGTLCSNLVYAQEGGQYSYRVEFSVENVMPWIGSYAIEDGSRKSSCYAGEIRAVYGDLIKVETRSSGYTGGGPNVVFDSLRVIQHYCGRITLINPKSVGGTIYHDQVDNSREGGTNAVRYRNATTAGSPIFLPRASYQPAFQIGAVLENCTLTYVSRRNVCPVGARIGISDWVNPVIFSDGAATNTEAGSAFSGKSIRLEIEMGDRSNPGDVTGTFSGTTWSVPAVLGTDGIKRRPGIVVGQFLRHPDLPYWLRVTAASVPASSPSTNIDIPATYTLNQAVPAGTRTVDTKASADMFDAFWADYGTGSTIWADGNLQGNIRITGGWQQGTIHVSAAWVRAGYTVIFDDSAGEPTTDFIIHGPMDLAEVAAIPWPFKGCKVLSVNDFEGKGIIYNGTHWVPEAPVVVPGVSLEALGSPFNASFIKRKGLSLINRDDGLPYYATGGARGDAWVTPGGTPIAVDLLNETKAFQTRVKGAGAFDAGYQLAFDRFLHDLKAAGVYTSNPDTSVMKGFWAMMGPDTATAQANMLFPDWSLDLYDMDQAPGVGLMPTSDFGYSEVHGWAALPRNTHQHDIMVLASCGQLMTSAESQYEVGGPYFTIGANSETFRATFHRKDGGNYVQFGTEDIVNALSQAGTDPDLTTGYRIGMAWTTPTTPPTQSIRMLGAQTLSGDKEVVSNALDVIWFGRSELKYLPRPLEFGGIGSGGITSEQAGRVLVAINTLRSALISLA